jgi:4-amino-4-deoxy-L-arabinose transferase-like glycosyltransferase
VTGARRWLAFAALIWAALVVAGLALRPPIPIDETRYLAVALEMWQRGDLLVPYRNGEAYHHKPPLLFWLMHLGWAVFGVSEIWARLVAPLFALGSLVATCVLARRLWPERPDVAAIAPLVLIACVWFGVVASLTLFDAMVTFFALAGWIGVVDAWQGRARRGWTIVAVALGLGILAKGPVQLLHLAPAALLAPLWMTRARPASWARWYGGFALAVLGGAAIALAWAVPAAIAGGEEFARKIFLGQHTGRVVKAFSHSRPFWWYLPVLAGLLFPFLWWFAPWRGLRAARGLWSEPGLRLAALTALAVLAAFSAISGKQPHYVLPEFALFALIVARLADREGFEDRRLDRLVPALGLLAGGVAMMALPFVVQRLAAGRSGIGVPLWFGILDEVVGLALVAFALWLWRDRPRSAPARAATISAGAGAMLLAVNVGFLALAPAYDTGPVSRVLADLQAQGRPIGITSDYESEFHFAARLSKPFADEIGAAKTIPWALANPDGVVIHTYARRAALPSDFPQPLFLGPFRGRLLAIWPSETIAGPRGAEILNPPR